MRIKPRTLCSLVVLTASLAAVAQQMPASPIGSPVAVYLVEFTLANNSQNLQARAQSLSAFATTIAQLKLAESDDLTITRLPIPPRCGSRGPEQSAQMSSQSSAQVDAQVVPRTPYYLIHGSIEPRSPEVQNQLSKRPNTDLGEMVLNFELSKVVECISQPLIRRSSPFRQNNALQTFSLMSDLLALRLRDAVAAHLKIDVQAVTTAGQSADETRAANALGDAILQHLSQNGDYEPRDLRQQTPAAPGEYTLQTKLQLKRKLKPLLLHSDVSGATVELSVLANNNVLWSKTVPRDFGDKNARPIDDQLAALYADVADSALKGLNSARSAQASIGKSLKTVSDSELRAKIDELLCTNAAPGCHSQPDVALPLLFELTQRNPEAFEPMELLGRTQSQLGQYLDAAQSFESQAKAAETQPTEKKIRWLNESGDAWYRAQNYDKASEKYKASLEEAARHKDSFPDELRVQPEIRLQLARSLRFDGDRKAALQSLLESLALVNDPIPFNAELRELFAALHPNELAWVESQIEASQAHGLDPNVLAVLYAQNVAQELRSATDSTNSGPDLVKTDQELRKIEAIPQEKLSAASRAMILRERAEWYWSGTKWTNAEPLLKQALALDPTPTNQHELALFYYTWASTAPGLTPEKLNELWRRAAEEALPIVLRRNSDSSDDIVRYADTIYRQSNHHLGKSKDEESREQFKKIIESHPGDISALNALMGVCGDYLQDFPCALEAARGLDKSGIEFNAGDLLDLAETYVLNRQYDQALSKIQRVVADPETESGYRVVAYFYQTWVQLGKGNLNDAELSAKLWTSNMPIYRKENKTPTWLFGGAPIALDQEHNVAGNYKIVLHKMIDAMNDPAAALPSFPH